MPFTDTERVEMSETKTITIHNAFTDEIVVREMTPEEIATLPLASPISAEPTE